MITPRDARRYIESSGAGYGQNVTLPDEIDTSNCEKFFGIRCSHNVHVTGKRRAHIDRIDPRKNSIGHLKKDVGIPYVVLGASGGATLGALIYKNDRKKGAIVGGIIGTIIGAFADLESNRG
jgi:hypothetical protein